MAFDQDDDRRKVLDASDIADVVGEHIALKPKGREFVALCPFHDDRNPSMYVVPHKGLFHCFVCQAGGDVFTFIQKYHGMSFPEALKWLADRAGIELTPRTQRRRTEPRPEHETDIPRADLVATNEAAQRYFVQLLNHESHGQAARELIERRGIAPEMVEAFGIGAAADRWDGLITAAEQRNLSPEALRALGLIKARETGGDYDALRNRLIFPIRAESGETIAFGARRIDDDDEPKYLNSPESPLFEKRKTLFGLDLARDAIRQARQAVVVEGYTDVVACHQAGIARVVGTLGTALTTDHARRLRGKCDEIVLLFDGDEAGQRAAERAFEVLFSGGMDVRVAMLSTVTDAKDPDELLKRDGGTQILDEAIDKAEHLIDFWARRLRNRLQPLGPAARSRESSAEIEKLARLGLTRLPPIDRRILTDKIAAAIGVSPQSVIEAMPTARGRFQSGPRADAPDTNITVDRPSPNQKMRRRLLALCMAAPKRALDHEERLPFLLDPDAATTEGMGREDLTELARIVLAIIADGDEPAQSEVLLTLSEREDADHLRRAVTTLVTRLETESGDDPIHLAEEMDAVIARIDQSSPSSQITSPDPLADPAAMSTIEGERSTDRAQHSTPDLHSRLERAKQQQREPGGNPTANPYRSNRPRA